MENVLSTDPTSTVHICNYFHAHVLLYMYSLSYIEHKITVKALLSPPFGGQILQ